MLKLVEKEKKNSVHETFIDMEDNTFKVWNRCATYFNICMDVSRDEAAKYAKQFSVEDIDAMTKLLAIIKEHGYDKTKNMIIKGELVIQ